MASFSIWQTMWPIVIMMGLVLLAGILLLLPIIAASSNDRGKDEGIRVLIRQGARWTVAAKQDDNPMIAVLHANYGAGYLWAVNDIATSNEIERATGVDYHRYKTEITAVQDATTRRLAALCPGYAPSKGYLETIGGEGV